MDADTLRDEDRPQDSGPAANSAPPTDPAPEGPQIQPLFEHPQAQALSRVGVIDVGSNSVRMVVFDGAARSPAYFFNEKILCGLGRGMAESGRLNPQGREMAMRALRRFAALARGMALSSRTAVATAALRDASDGPEFREEVLQATGLQLGVIDGDEEARLSAQGVLLGWPEAEGLVCDIGGASMELAEIAGAQVGARVSTPLGPFRLQNIPGGQKGLKAHVRAVLEGSCNGIGRQHERLYLVGGSWRAIARLDMERRGYPLTVLHEYTMTPRSLRATMDWMRKQDLKALRKRTGLSAERMELVPIAAVVLRQMLRRLAPRSVHVSAYGVREGVLYERMPAHVRRQDPLIEACRHAEAIGARMPGFGDKLFSFLQPLYKSAPEARQRLVRAACLLHDVNWRVHPDYRSQACFDSVTRANLGALDHGGRMFLGMALMHRYKNAGAPDHLHALIRLLDDTARAEAEILGKALRFGAMFSIAGPESAGRLKYYPRKHRLELTLDPEAADLFGDVARNRFEALAKALKAQTGVRLRRATGAGNGA